MRTATILNASQVRSLIKPRAKDSNKGDYGHVLVIAGSRGMSGAAVMCANAALRSGAGLVTAAIPEGQQGTVGPRLRPEALTLPLPENASGGLDIRSFDILTEYITRRRVSALVIGPGMGNTRPVYQLVRELLRAVVLPVVLDADGINVFVEERGKDLGVRTFRESPAEIILTPHPGEMGRIIGESTESVQETREETALRFARSNNLIVVLKGYRTVVASPEETFVNMTGNPGMAKGGSGDVLSGMLASLVAQVSDPNVLNAALAGVYLHGLAGDLAADDKTQIGMLPGDIIDNIPRAVRKVMHHG